MANPTVTQIASDLSSRLQRLLGADFIVAKSPDHPLVMRSVDILIGGNAQLTAVMIMSAAEQKDSRVFLARLALNKLALPSHTNFVHIERWPGKPALADNVSVTLSLSDPELLKELASLAVTPVRRVLSPLAQNARQLAAERFGDTYRLARILFRGGRDEKQGYLQRSSRRPSRERLSPQIEAATFSSPPTMSAIASLSYEGASRWFVLDGRDVLPTSALGSVLFASSLPESLGDPDKALRAAAFSGWVFAPLNNPRSKDEVSSLVDKYARLK